MNVNCYYKASSDNCPICHETMVGTFSVCHSNGGENHTIHQRCLIAWTNMVNICPICQKQIDKNSLTSLIPPLKYRIIGEIKLAKEEGFNGPWAGITGHLLIVSASFNFTPSYQFLIVALSSTCLAAGILLNRKLGRRFFQNF